MICHLYKLAPCQWGFQPDSHPHKLMINYSMIIAMWHAFTKMAVSPLIMVRFAKFKICHAQDFDADLSDVTLTLHATRHARWRHTCARMSQVRPLLQQSLSIMWLLWAVAMGLSHEPCGRFRSFSPSKSIWPKRLYIPKKVTPAPILREQDSFYWIPWQRFGCHRNRYLKPLFPPIRDLPVEFGADRA